MIRLWLRGGASLLIVFGLAVGAIVAQPRDDDAMRDFFAAPEGCAAPCFLGIQVGSTTEDEARAILRTQPWINAITTNPTGLSWVWNGQQPPFVSRTDHGLYFVQIDFQGGVASMIRMTTAMTWGDFYYVFGPPDREVYITENSAYSYYVIHDATYYAQNFQVETEMVCPTGTHDALWHTLIYITWPAPGTVSYGRMTPVRGC